MGNPHQIKIKTGDNTYQEIYPINTVDEVYINDVKLSTLFSSDGNSYLGTPTNISSPAVQILRHDAPDDLPG